MGCGVLNGSYATFVPNVSYYLLGLVLTSVKWIQTRLICEHIGVFSTLKFSWNCFEVDAYDCLTALFSIINISCAASYTHRGLYEALRTRLKEEPRF